MRVRLAVHRWQQAHPGLWPESLAELVPEYLPEIPKDPWNGQPLLWDAASKIVYAVGADWKPDLPVFKKDSQAFFSDNDAPGLRMELPPATPAAAADSPPPVPAARRVILGKPEEDPE